jgi:hypothetical protein
VTANGKTRKSTNDQTTKPSKSQTGKASNVFTGSLGLATNWVARKHENNATGIHVNTTTRMTIAMTKRAPLTFKTQKVTQVPADEKQTGLPANTKPSKRAKSKTKTGREGRQFIAGHVMPDAAKQFKLLAVQQDKDVQELLIEAINDIFAKYGLSRIA